MEEYFLPQDVAPVSVNFTRDMHSLLLHSMSNKNSKSTASVNIYTFIEPFFSGVQNSSAENKALNHAASLLIDRLPEERRAEVVKNRKQFLIFYAYWLSKNWTIEEILNLILDKSYYGRNYVGLTDAAEGYFGLEPSNLDDEQLIILFLLIQSPKKYDPWCNSKILEQKLIEIQKSGSLNFDPEKLKYKHLMKNNNKECL